MAVMRVTNSLLVSNYINDINMNMRKMMKLQSQMTSNKKINRLSDDPVGVIKSLNARSKLKDIEQYRKTITSANARLAASETAIMDMDRVMKRAYELAVYMANDTNTSDERSAAAAEIKELMGHLLSVVNSTHGDEYLFGAFNVMTSPFTLNAAGEIIMNLNAGGFNMVTLQGEPGLSSYLSPGYATLADLEADFPDIIGDPEYAALAGLADFSIIMGIDGKPTPAAVKVYNNFGEVLLDDPAAVPADYADVTWPSALRLTGGLPTPVVFNSELYTQLQDIIEYEVGFGIRMAVQIPGPTLLGTGDKNAYEIMRQFYNVLMDPDSGHDEIRPFIDRFKNAEDVILNAAAEIGGKMNRLEMMEVRFGQEYINYTRIKSDVEDIDPAEVIMWFSMAEAVYRATLSMGSRVIQPTLMDFLKP